jgi:hypothetical protein
MAQWIEFQEFQRFKQMKAAASAPSFFPSTFQQRAPPAAPPVFRVLPPVREIKYEKVFNHLMAHMKVFSGQHKVLVYHFKNLYREHPERFSLIGKLHGDVGNQYFSYLYSEAGEDGHETRATFHIYGHVNGTKFFMKSMDIKMETLYKDAWVWVNDDAYSTNSS